MYLEIGGIMQQGIFNVVISTDSLFFKIASHAKIMRIKIKHE